MRRGLVHAAAWVLATGAAVTLSWFGVHTVLSGTVYDAPRALPLSDQAPSAVEGAHTDVTPRSSSTHRPKPSPSGGAPSPSGDAPSPSRSTGSAHSPSPAPHATPESGGHVKSYATAGGRVVFDLGKTSAQLVSATPGAGWEMQVWKQEQWIRVDFTGATGHSSVICTWNGHEPTVVTSDNAT